MHFQVAGLNYAQMKDETKRDVEVTVEVQVTNTTNLQLQEDGSNVRITQEDVTAEVLPPQAFTGAGGDWLAMNRRLQTGVSTDGVTVNVTIVMPTIMQSTTVESALVSSGSSLRAGIVIAVGEVQNITAATTGDISIPGPVLITSFVMPTPPPPTPMPTPAPTPAPTPIPTIPCNFSLVGHGYCGYGGTTGEVPLRLTSWASGSLRDAQAACCENAECGGFHYDMLAGDFVQLDLIGTPDNHGGTRRECWDKVSPEDSDRSTDAAASLFDCGRLSLLATLIATATSVF